ncbi:MAG: type 4a pilus biogenesis protein PilO [Candidatus Yanofskybacteria bacterium]|nr:type 4a pilus biogenesis protein PilO [Candidatus Yanofskybacteria bacterium]
MNYKKLIAAGLVALGIILLPVLVVSEYYTLTAVKGAISEKKTALDKKKALMVKIEDLRNQTKEKHTGLEKLATVLPEGKETHEVVVNIEEMSKQSGVELKTLKTALIQQGGTSSNGPRSMQVEVGGAGQYRAILDFIKLTEKNLRILDIQEFTLSLDTSATAAGGLNFAAKINTYFIEKPLTP